jgi:hypothetical protein
LRPRVGSMPNTHIACIYNVGRPAHRTLVIDADVVEGVAPSGSPWARRRRRWSALVDDVLADRAFVERATTRPPSWPRSPTSPGTGRPSIARMWSPMPWRRRRSPGPTASPRSRSATGCARSVPEAAPDRRGGHGWGRALCQRLQGDQPARRGGRAWRPSSGSCGSPGVCSRAPTSTRSSRRSLAGCAGSSSSAPIGPDRGSLARHAPDVPVVDAGGPDTGGMQTTGDDADLIMDRVVARAADLVAPRGRRPVGTCGRVDGHVRQLWPAR